MDETIFELLDESELIAALHADCSRPRGTGYHRVSTDSRQVCAGDLFFALSGEKFDAHDFLPDVMARGCRGVVVSRECGDLPSDAAVYRVDDVCTAFGRLASAVLKKRRTFGNFVTYAITGSNGKTTTKELLAALLAAQGHCVLKTAGNFNNFVGMPMTVMRLTRRHDAAVLEMGANAPGEIAYLSGFARPDAAIITCVGAAHLGGFGSMEGVAAAKGEMLDNPTLKRIVLPGDTRRFYENREVSAPVTWVGDGEKIHTSGIVSDLNGIEFDYVDEGRGFSDRVHLPLLGAHNAGNLAKALAAVDADWAPGAISAAVSCVRLPSGRLEPWRTPDGVSFLHDAYNANPSSMKQALDLMAQISEPQHRCLILGEMRELGVQSDDCHVALGAQAARIGVKKLLCVGESAECVRQGALGGGISGADIFCTAQDALESGLEWLKKSLVSQDICLVKGSHSVALERVLDYFGAVRVESADKI